LDVGNFAHVTWFEMLENYSVVEAIDNPWEGGFDDLIDGL
jgi:hypothetical protein